MRERRYTYETTLAFGSDERADYAEVDVTVSFTVSWGRPATAPCYSHGGLPADPDEIDDIRLEKIGDRPAPWNLHHHSDKHFAAIVAEKLEASDDHLAAMLEIACEQEAADYDDAMERRWEDRRGEAA